MGPLKYLMHRIPRLSCILHRHILTLLLAGICLHQQRLLNATFASQVSSVARRAQGTAAKKLTDIPAFFESTKKGFTRRSDDNESSTNWRKREAKKSIDGSADESTCSEATTSLS